MPTMTLGTRDHFSPSYLWKTFKMLGPSRGTQSIDRLSAHCHGDSWFSDAYQWDNRLAPFVRTLARRPDLARLIKVIYISHHIFSTSEDKEQSRRNILLEAAGALGIDLPAAWEKRVEIRDSICPLEKFDWPDIYPIFSEFYLDDHPRMTEKQERQLRRVMAEKSMPGRRWMNAELVAMLLAHTPNIEIISIQSSPGWPTCGIAKSSPPVLGVTHLPVKRLDLGLQTGPIINICDNLEALNCPGYNLRITDGSLSSFRLSKILEGCTGGLVAFEYEAGYGWGQNDDQLPTRNFQLSDAIESLRHHRSTLQVLHLDVTARSRDIRRAKPGINMRDYTSLQYLWISTILLCPSARMSDRPADVETFMDFLPCSIVSLEIYRDFTCSTDGAVQRVAAVKREKFPFLKKVVYGPKDRRNLRQAFEVEGVSFSIKIYSLSLAKGYLQGPNTDSRLEFPDWDSDEELRQGEK
ncbi:uncharacterized protein FFB14_12648 [Fusarium fujikuroi]|nr:uncharacterized protein FFB14_12648 [Fusarium fujikuroi]